MKNRRQIMNSAWQLARSGAAQFGGGARLYFACALRLVWQETAEKPRALWRPELHGSVYVLPGVPLPRIPVKTGQQFFLEMVS